MKSSSTETTSNIYKNNTHRKMPSKEPQLLVEEQVENKNKATYNKHREIPKKKNRELSETKPE